MILFSSNYIKHLKYRLITKFNYNSTKEVPNFSKIVLSLGDKKLDKRDLLSSLLFLKLITNKKIVCTKSKISNTLLKIKKGSPTGCKVILRGFDATNFLLYSFQKILPSIKSFKGLTKKLTKSSYSYQISRILAFKEIGVNYSFFKKLSHVNIKVFAVKASHTEFNFLLRVIQTPFANNSRTHDLNGRV